MLISISLVRIHFWIYFCDPSVGIWVNSSTKWSSWSYISTLFV
uniref:Uncharacterized protein n=1 Tax=Arundo donax TaxID=35708 RepID=A0A0A8ZMA6_ARUDO